MERERERKERERIPVQERDFGFFIGVIIKRRKEKRWDECEERILKPEELKPIISFSVRSLHEKNLIHGGKEEYFQQCFKGKFTAFSQRF